MKIVFPVMGAENISVQYLSTVMRDAGHEVQVAFDRSLFDDKQYFTVPFLARMFSETDNVVDAIVKAKPDVLAMSIFADNYKWGLDIAEKVRERCDCITVWGGIHPTSCPEDVIKENVVDYVIIGEGEAPFIELLTALESDESPESIPNVWMKKGDDVISNKSRVNMLGKNFPAPDKTLFENLLPMGEYYLTVTSKGCIQTCNFCMQNFLQRWEKEQGLGMFLREKPVQDVLDELKYARDHRNVKYIDIKNNVLSGNKKWLNEFLTRYPKEVGVPFRCMGHPLLLQNPKLDLPRKLKAAGCAHVQIGIESFNPDVRKKVLGRGESDEQIIKALDDMEAAGVRFSADLIVGLPGESEDDLIKSLHILSKYKCLVRASIFWLQYLPEVDITKNAFEAGLIDRESIKMMVQGEQENYLSTGSPMEAERERILKTYHVLFRMLPITSEWVIKKMLSTKIYRILHFIPFQVALIIFIDVIVSLVRNDYYSKWIMKWYMKHILKRVFGKANFISDVQASTAIQTKYTGEAGLPYGMTATPDTGGMVATPANEALGNLSVSAK